MLVPAIQYKDEIEKEFQRIQYSEKYLWYTGSIDNYDIEVKTEGDKFAFAIICQEHLIGYISFRVDWYCSMAYNFSLIKFKDIKGRGRMICKDVFKVADKSTLVMASALREVIRMIESFKLHRIDFRCVSGNPVWRKYDHLLLWFHRRDWIGNMIVFRDNIKDRQGYYHDTIVYELIRR